MKIGLLQTGHSPEEMKKDLGDYDDLFKKLLADHGLEFEVWRVVDGEMPPSIHAAEGWLITGSRHGVYEDHPWIPPLEAVHPRRLRRGRAASSASASATRSWRRRSAARSRSSRAAGPSAGTNTTGAERRSRMNAWHQDQVVREARGRHRPRLEPHLRLRGTRLRRPRLQRPDPPRVQLGRNRLPPRASAPRAWSRREKIERATANLDKPLDNPRLADRIAGFFKEARHG